MQACDLALVSPVMVLNFTQRMNMDEIEKRWREKYYDKVAELNAAEAEIDWLRGYIEGAIQNHYWSMKKDYLAKDEIENFRESADKRYSRKRHE